MFSSISRSLLHNSAGFTRVAFAPASVHVRLMSKKLFSKDHEWIEFDASEKNGTIGVTKHAAQALGDIVYVELPAVKTTLKVGSAFGVVESTKAASDVYSPVNGVVSEINKAAESDPALISRDPEGSGWMIKVALSQTDLSKMMDESAYRKFCDDEKH